MAKYRAIRNSFYKGRLYEAGEIVETDAKMSENFECIDAPKPEKPKKGNAPAEQPVEAPVEPEEKPAE